MTDSELKIIISFLFKRSGKEEMTASELYLPLSIDLQWFTPKEAKELINSAIQQKMLIKKGSLVKPAFDYKKVVVPIGFHPSERSFKEEYEEEPLKKEEIDVLRVIVNRIVTKSGNNEKNVVEKINKIVKEKNIVLEVAALTIGKEYDLKFEDFFEIIEDKIFRDEKT